MRFVIRLHVHRLSKFLRLALIIIRRWKRIPDPFLGPKGVRTLLFLRGIAGWVSCGMRNLVIASHFYHRFFTIWGVLFSLQHLSLPDATVLTYLTPILTGFTGALFLGEVLSVRESLAGRENS